MNLRIRSDADKGAVKSYIDRLPVGKDYDISITPHKEVKQSRSNNQNALMWSWLRIISKETGNSAEDLDKIFCRKFLGVEVFEILGERLAKVKSSKTLKTDEMTDYLTQIESFAVQELGIILPHPEDAYLEQMMNLPY